MIKVIIKILLSFLLLLGLIPSYANDYPVLTEIVTDNANIFGSSELHSLRKKLKKFEAETSNQLVVVTIESLEGESIESFSLEVFNRNKLGQKDIDNGVLILFSKVDREVRIEVGYGLEHVLTDITSHHIIQDIMIPEFKDKNYFRGIDLATDKIIELINKPELAEEFNKGRENFTGSTIFLSVFGLLVAGFLFIFVFIGSRLFIGNYHWCSY